MKKLCILGYLIFANVAFSQIPQTMSYQGVLTDASGTAVADGDYSLTFNLYESATGGSSLWGETQAVDVVNGVFNAILGSVKPLSNSFDRPYWLGIAIGSDAELEPRIELTASPYSLTTRSVADSAVTSGKIADGQVVRSLNAITDEVIITGEGGVVVTTRNDSIIVSAGSGGEVTGIQQMQSTDNSLIITNSTGPATTINVNALGITTDKLADEAVTTAKISDSAVTNSKIANNAVSTARLANNAVTTAKITSNAVVSAKIASDAVTTTKIANNAVTTAKIADGSVTTAKLAAGVGPDNDWTISGNNMFSAVSGNVGIGTTNPISKLDLRGGSDVSVTGGGYLTLGKISSTNIGIDNNEIMARNNGATSTLNLNINGGTVAIGGPTTMNGGSECNSGWGRLSNARVNIRNKPRHRQQ